MAKPMCRKGSDLNTDLAITAGKNLMILLCFCVCCCIKGLSASPGWSLKHSQRAQAHDFRGFFSIFGWPCRSAGWLSHRPPSTTQCGAAPLDQSWDLPAERRLKACRVWGEVGEGAWGAFPKSRLQKSTFLGRWHQEG